MPLQANYNATVLRRYTTPASIWYGVTKPANWTPLTHTTGTPTGGTDFGFTQGAATLTYRPTIATVAVEQVFGNVAPHLSAEAASLAFTITEPTYARILQALANGTGTTSGGMNLITFGGKTAISDQCVALLAQHSDEPEYTLACIYNAVSLNGVSRNYQKGTEPRVQLTFDALPDETREAGDQLFQYVDQEPSLAA